MSAAIRHLETLAMNAWPAQTTELFDGWVMRFAGGYTKRANSVSPLYAGEHTLVDKLAYCEARYRALGLPPVFKMTALAPELDALLADRDYQVVEPSSVQTVTLMDQPLARDPAVSLNGLLAPEWFAAFAAICGLSPQQHGQAQALLQNYACDTAFGLLYEAGEAVACGLAVRQHDMVLLFDIATAQPHRQRGYGRRMVSSLMHWGRQRGARQGLLQVVATNEPALALYAGFGFEEQYRYWYRRQAVTS